MPTPPPPKGAVPINTPPPPPGATPIDNPPPPAGATDQTPPEQPGFFSSLGKSFGLTPENAQAEGDEMRQHPVKSLLTHAFNAAVPGAGLLSGAYQGAKHSLGELGTGIRQASEGNPTGLLSHGISAIPIIGPAMDQASEQAPAPTQGESYLDRIGDVAGSPGSMGTLVGAAAKTAPLLEASGATGAAKSGLSDLNQRFNPLPLRSRAAANFQSVANDVGNAPVQTTNTAPAIRDFRNYVRTGGQQSEIVPKLINETGPNKPPLSFPDARSFYTNVSRETERPGLFRRMMEPSSAPDMRRNLGPVREGLKSDLTDTAEQVGRGEDYTAAGKEYANNAKLRRLGLIGAGIAGGEVARRTGLLGKVASKVIGQ